MRLIFWDILLTFVYIVSVVLGLILLVHSGRLATFIPTGDLFLIVLAVYRLVQLFTDDSITDFIREWSTGALRTSWRGTVGTIFSCPWCMSMWIAPIVLFAYFANVYFWYVIVILAISALGSILKIIIDSMRNKKDSIQE